MIKKIAFNRNSKPDFCNVIKTVLNQSTATTWIVSPKYRELADKFMLNKSPNEFSKIITKKLKVFGVTSVDIYHYDNLSEDNICYEFNIVPVNVGIRLSKRIFFTNQGIYDRAFKSGCDVLFLEI
jgi:hypothetical protein